MSYSKSCYPCRHPHGRDAGATGRMDDLDDLLRELDSAGVGDAGGGKGGGRPPPSSRTTGAGGRSRASFESSARASSSVNSTASTGGRGGGDVGVAVSNRNGVGIRGKGGKGGGGGGIGLGIRSETSLGGGGGGGGGGRKKSESLDDLLADLDDALSDGATASSARPPAPSGRLSSGGFHVRSSSGGGRGNSPGSILKCAPCPLIGSTRLALGGPCSFFEESACATLRCTSCDFDVVSFEGAGWVDGEEGVDYMFFRNNYPSESKMRTLMSRVSEARAYCCQCSWRTMMPGAKEKVDSVGGTLRWVCGGH